MKIPPRWGWAVRLMTDFYEDATPTGLGRVLDTDFYDDTTPMGLG